METRAAKHSSHAAPPASPTRTEQGPGWSYLSAVTLGLLSSSCCVIQLVLNAMSVGCAGFSVLTPFRPVFISLSVLTITYTVLKYRLSARTALTLVITLVLTLSPEVVSLVNQGSLSTAHGPAPALSSLLHQQIQAILDTSIWRPSSTVAKGSDKQDAHSLVPLVKYEVLVQGMACEACGNRLKQSLMQQPGVENVKVFFNDKKVYLWTRSGPLAFQLSDSDISKMISSVDEKYSSRLLGVYSDERAEL